MESSNARTGCAIAAKFPEVIAALTRIPGGEWVLDGELVVTHAHRHASFKSLRRRGVMKLQRSSINAAAGATPAAYCVFDLLLVDGVDLRALPLRNRKEMLDGNWSDTACWWAAKAISAYGSCFWLELHGEALFEHARELYLEGVVGKELSAPYRRGVQRTWAKIKNPQYSGARR